MDYILRARSEPTITLNYTILINADEIHTHTHTHARTHAHTHTHTHRSGGTLLGTVL